MSSFGDWQPDNNTLYRLLASNIPNAAIFVLDQQLRYVLADGAELHRRGYTPDMFTHKHLREVVPKEIADIYEPIVRRTLTGETTEGEVEFMGEMYWTQTVPVHEADGRVVGCLLLSMNITERKLAEIAQAEHEGRIAALEKEQELSTQRNKMMLRIAHEFRNPLAIIMSSSEIMRRYKARMTAEQQQEHFGNIERQIKHLTHLLDEIASVVQRHDIDIDLEMVNLQDYCRHCLTTYHPGIALTFTGDIEPVMVDTELLRVILQHLLSNAVKYSAADQKVTLQVEVSAETITLVVRDQGIGIPPGDLPFIFDPFFRGSNFSELPGLGLGLTKVQQAVRLYGGDIHLESQPGAGTTFTITLPRIE